MKISKYSRDMAIGLACILIFASVVMFVTENFGLESDASSKFSTPTQISSVQPRSEIRSEEADLLPTSGVAFKELDSGARIYTIKNENHVKNLLISPDIASQNPQVTPGGEISLTDNSGNKILLQQGFEPEFDGYIVELKEKPLTTKKKEIEQEIASMPGISRSVDTTRQLNSQKNTISTQQNSFASKARERIGDKGTITKRFSKTLNAVVLKDATAEDIERIKSLPEVKNVYENRKVYALLDESVPLINADDVWKLDKNGNLCEETGNECLTGKGITIAIIDTGVDYTHPDLGGCTEDQFLAGTCGKVTGGYDFVNNDNNPMDDQGHGTHVAATAAGNGVLKGVAPDADIIALKVLDSYGSGSWETIIESIEYATDPNGDNDFSDHYDIISMSLGGYGSPDDAISLSIDNAVENGVIAVIAAGNSGPSMYTIGSPGTARRAITVGAVDKNEYIAYFSSRGPTSIGTMKPDVVAPGVSICAAQWDNAFANGERENCNSDDNHVAISGTSMATPHVSGVAALVKQVHPDWSSEEIKFAIKNTAKDLGLEYIAQGSGEVDALASVQLQNPPPVARLQHGWVEAHGTIEVLGTIESRDFKKYEISIADSNSYPYYTWTKLYESNQMPESEVLLRIDTLQLNGDGYYILNLKVINNDNSYSNDYVTAKVNNIQINSPYSNEYFESTEIIPINVTSYHRGNYTVNWFNKSNLSNEGIQLNNISFPAENTTIALWRPAFASPGLYTLQIEINDKKSYVDIILNSGSKPGWPRKIDWDLADSGEYYYWPGYLVPVVDDIDKDGKSEAIFYAGGNPAKIYVFNYDGTLKSGWPSAVEGIDLSGGNIGLPTVGDIDGDGYKEIIVNGIGKTGSSGLSSENLYYIFDHRGMPKGGIKAGDERFSWAALELEPVIADINNDGNVEIITTYEAQYYNYNDSDHGKYLAVYDNQGNLLWKKIVYDFKEGGGYISSHLLAAHEQTPAIGNFDDDEDFEIAIGNIRNVFEEGFNESLLGGYHGEGRVYVFDTDGSILPGFPVDVEGPIYGPLSVGDSDKDGYDEIYVGSFMSFSSLNYGFYAINHTGGIIRGWPKGKETFGVVGIVTAPPLADFDSDGTLEILMRRYNNDFSYSMIVLDNYGGIKDSFNFIPNYFYFISILSSFHSFVVSDMNSDGRADISAVVENIFAWNHDGENIDKFPKMFTSYSGIAVSDLEQDGRVDLISTSGSLFNRVPSNKIYVWSLGRFNSSTMQWPQFEHDAQHTSNYAFPFEKPAVFCNANSVRGDVNGDGKVTDIDANLTRKVLLGTLKPPANLCCIDIAPGLNGDGRVDLFDYVTIKRAVSQNYDYGTCSNPKEGLPKMNLKCGTTVNASVRLGSDIDCTNGNKPALTIGANGITIDCDGKSIKGFNKQRYGIYLPARKKVNLMNCKISNFQNGVYLSTGSDNNNLTNINATNNTYGFRLLSAQNTIFTRSEGSGNQRGMDMKLASGTQLISSVFNKNSQYGVYSLQSFFLKFTNNQMCSNPVNDIYISRPKSNLGINNTCTNSAGWTDVNYIRGCSKECSDTTPPVLNYVKPTPADSLTTNQTNQTFNVTVSDASEIGECYFSIEGSFMGSGQDVHVKKSGSTRYCEIKKSLAPDTYDYIFSAVDSSGNKGVSASRRLTVTGSGGDTSPPVLTYVNPTPVDDLTTNQTNQTFNVTISDQSDIIDCLFYLDKIDYGPISVGHDNFGNHYCDLKKTLSVGKHSYYFYAQDSASNKGFSEMREIIITIGGGGGGGHG